MKLEVEMKNSVNRPSLVFSLLVVLSLACANDQAPSFQTKSGKAYKLQVSEATSDAEGYEEGDAQGIESMSEPVTEADEADAILSELETAMAAEEESTADATAEASESEDAADESESGEVAAEEVSSEATSKKGKGKPFAEEGEGSENADYPVDPSAAELKACSKLSGQSVEKIVIVNSETKPDIMANSVLAIKLAGNQTQVTLDLVGTEGVSLRSICVFATGNQPQFTLNNAVTLEQMVYVGRGNQSKGVVNVAEGASVGHLFGSLAGNAASLHISGAGTFDCSHIKLKNSKAVLACQ